MVRFLSDEWIAAADAAASCASVAPDATLVVDHTVADGDHEVRYHLVVADGTIAVRRGAAPEPTVTFRMDLATAWAIASGRASAQRAFMAGQLRVGGDLQALATNRGVFAAIDEALSPVRARTEPPEGIDAAEAGHA